MAIGMIVRMIRRMITGDINLIFARRIHRNTADFFYRTSMFQWLWGLFEWSPNDSYNHLISLIIIENNWEIWMIIEKSWFLSQWSLGTGISLVFQGIWQNSGMILIQDDGVSHLFCRGGSNAQDINQNGKCFFVQGEDDDWWWYLGLQDWAAGCWCDHGHHGHFPHELGI